MLPFPYHSPLHASFTTGQALDIAIGTENTDAGRQTQRLKIVLTLGLHQGFLVWKPLVSEFDETNERAWPLASAASSGVAELRGMEAVGMVMLGGSKPGVGASAFMRMKPVLSELLISTAAAPAAIAFTTCARRQTNVGYRSNRILQHDRRTYTFTCNTPQRMNTKCQPHVLQQEVVPPWTRRSSCPAGAAPPCSCTATAG